LTAQASPPQAKRRFKIWPIRFAVQLLSFLIVNALVLEGLGFELKLPRTPIVLPLLSSYYTSYVVGTLDGLQVALSKAEIPWIPLAGLLIICAVIGRAFCGWVCPIGFVQDVISTLSRDKGAVSNKTHSKFALMKFFVLFAIVLLSLSVAFSYRTAWGEDYRAALGVYATAPSLPLAPEGTIFRTLPQVLSWLGDPLQKIEYIPRFTGSWWDVPNFLQSILFVKVVIAIVFVYGAYRIPRFWCRYLCPMGAAMGIISKFSFLGLKRDPLRCPKCPHSEKACPMQIQIIQLPWEKFNDRECIFCFECIDACPHGAMGVKFP